MGTKRRQKKDYNLNNKHSAELKKTDKTCIIQQNMYLV